MPTRARLDELGEVAGRTRELQRIGPVLELEIEWSLSRDEPPPRARFEQLTRLFDKKQLATIDGPRLAAWGAIAGLAHESGGPMPAATPR